MSDGWLLQFGTDGAFAALLAAAHMVAVFVLGLPRHGMGSVRGLLIHAAVVAVLLVIALLPVMSAVTISVIPILAVLHAGVGRAGMALDGTRAGRWLPHHLLIQPAYAVVLLLAWAVLSGSMHTMWLDLSPARIAEATRIGVVVAAYAFNMHGGAMLVGRLLGEYGMGDPRPGSDAGAPDAAVADAVARGRVIGILERFIVLTLAIPGQWAAVGLVVAAKSIARFEALRERSFGEYYLMGTLASILIAALSAILITILI